MTEPIFSIVTISKNNAAGLKLTAKSIAVQQHVPVYEWIVIDGASTDGTAEMIAPFLDEQTQFISEPDTGIYDAMNKGFARAKGRYVWFLNAGDCLSDAYTLRDVANEIKYNMAPDFIYGDARENGKIKRARGADKYAWGMFTHHQAMVYRRAVIGDLGYDENYPIAADYAFTLHMLAKSQRTHYFPRVLCDFASGGVSQINAAQGRWENFYIRRDLLQLNPAINKTIFYLNGFTLWLKNRMPALYALARFSSRK